MGFSGELHKITGGIIGSPDAEPAETFDDFTSSLAGISVLEVKADLLIDQKGTDDDFTGVVFRANGRRGRAVYTERFPVSEDDSDKDLWQRHVQKELTMEARLDEIGESFEVPLHSPIRDGSRLEVEMLRIEAERSDIHPFPKPKSSDKTAS